MDLKLFSAFRNEYIQRKKEELELLCTVKLPAFKTLSIDCSKLNADELYCTDLLEKLEITKDSVIIYFLEVVSSQATGEIIDLVYSSKSKKRSKVKLPKINKDNVDSRILYVGKTNSNFRYRFITHLTLRSSATFALHLEHWAKEMGIQLMLYYSEIDLDGKPIEYIEMTESILHDYLKPILGRSGH